MNFRVTGRFTVLIHEDISATSMEEVKDILVKRHGNRLVKWEIEVQELHPDEHVRKGSS